MLKVCSKCNIEKYVSEFHKSGDGYCGKCKLCRNEENRIYKLKNKKKVKEYNRYYNSTDKAKEKKKKWREDNANYHIEYYLNNLDDIKDYQREWYENNKEWYKSERQMENKRSYMKRLYKEKPYIFAWRNILSRSITYFNTIKESKTIEILGYSSEDLKLHMESLFKEGMSWDNWGEWHIDHIYPLSKFDKSTPICVVNSLDNLQPLWAEDNLKKGNSIDG